MIFSEFSDIIRMYVPGAKTTVISPTVLDLLINKGVDDVNSYALGYVGSKKIDVVAEQQEYEIHTEISDFLLIGKSGLLWNSGTVATPVWKKLIPITKTYLNKHISNWRDVDSDDPIYYYIEANTIGIYPKPDTNLTDGFWLDDYYKSATEMTDSGDFPFSGSPTQIVSLLDFDDVIVDYVRWKLQKVLGNKAQGVISEAEYVKLRAEKSLLIKRRPDIGSSTKFRMKIPSIH